MERKVKIAVRLRNRAGYHEALAELKAALEDATFDQVMRIFSFRFYIWELKSAIPIHMMPIITITNLIQ